MLKKILNFDDLEQVTGGRLYVLTDNNGIYVSNNQGDAVIIPRNSYNRYHRAGYTDGQIVVSFHGRNPQAIYPNLQAFKAVLHPNINYRIVDVNGNYIA